MNKALLKFMILIILINVSGLSYSQTSYVGTVKSMQAGDVACYVDLIGEDGNTYESMADFEICEKRWFIGKKVKLNYEQGNVLAASCNGDMDCGRTDTVWIINQMSEIQKPVQPQYSDVPSHCFQNEEVIFSCNTNSNKVVSVCASKNINRNYGYFQYRFGSIGSFPEFVFPMNHDKASKFFYSGTLMYSGGGGAYLKFINANYNYVVYTGIGKGWSKQGLVISEGEDEISRYSCRGTWESEIGPELFSKVGLYEDEYGFAIPVN